MSTPFTAVGAQGAAIPLAILSWLLVPALIGTVVAGVAQAWVLRFVATRPAAAAKILEDAVAARGRGA